VGLLIPLLSPYVERHGRLDVQRYI